MNFKGTHRIMQAQDKSHGFAAFGRLIDGSLCSAAGRRYLALIGYSAAVFSIGRLLLTLESTLG